MAAFFTTPFIIITPIHLAGVFQSAGDGALRITVSAIMIPGLIPSDTPITATHTVGAELATEADITAAFMMATTVRQATVSTPRVGITTGSGDRSAGATAAEAVSQGRAVPEAGSVLSRARVVKM